MKLLYGFLLLAVIALAVEGFPKHHEQKEKKDKSSEESSEEMTSTSANPARSSTTTTTTTTGNYLTLLILQFRSITFNQFEQIFKVNYFIIL